MATTTTRDVSDAVVLATEQRSLRTYMCAMLVLAVAGFAAYSITEVSATQLDGVISMIMPPAGTSR